MTSCRVRKKSIFDDEIFERFKALRIPTVFVNPIRRHLIQVILPSIRDGRVKCEDEKDEADIYDTIPNISIKSREILKNEYRITTSTLENLIESEDQSTIKLLIMLNDGNKIESVIMRYGCVQFKKYEEEVGHVEKGTSEGRNFKSKSRATLCLSSQVGCGMACTFCATGSMGLIRSLSSSEIIEQLWHASKILHIRNIVFMGMGEPLNNYANAVSSIKFLVDQGLFGISQSRITVSTVGVVYRLKQMSQDIPFVSLAFSLHAPTDEMRIKLVPSSKAYKIKDILEACDEFSSVSGRPYMVEYVLIDNVNDQPDTAHTVGRLLENRNVTVNLIPYNPTPVPHDYRTPPVERVREFTRILRAYGIRASCRQTLGGDVNSACGQLYVKNNLQSPPDTVDLEDLFPAPKEVNFSNENASSIVNDYAKTNKHYSLKLTGVSKNRSDVQAKRLPRGRVVLKRTQSVSCIYTAVIIYLTIFTSLSLILLSMRRYLFKWFRPFKSFFTKKLT